VVPDSIAAAFRADKVDAFLYEPRRKGRAFRRKCCRGCSSGSWRDRRNPAASASGSISRSGWRSCTAATWSWNRRRERARDSPSRFRSMRIDRR